MKISPTAQGITGSKAADSAERPRATQADASKSMSPAGTDSVQLSQTSAHLQALASSLAGPEFDQAKVEEIKEAIRSGSLAVNPQVVADKMLANVQEWMKKAN